MLKINGRTFGAYSLRVLVREDKAETVSPGGIVMITASIDAKQERNVIGQIVHIDYEGYEALGEKITLKVGDYVMFARYAGTVTEGDDGELYRLLDERDIRAKEIKE